MSKALERLEEFAIDVILERRYGKRAALLRLALYGLSHVYRWIVRLRLRLFEERLAEVYTLGCQVISVGNLTVGGTGKTPVVEKLARALTQGGRKVAILSRGYKSQPRPLGERLMNRFRGLDDRTPPRIVSDGRSLLLGSDLAGDEPYMLAKNLRDVLVLVDKDRIKSGLHAIKEHGVDTLVLDDGFQYLKLKERLDILLIDRETPWGNGYLLPRGTLREPPEHLRRANIIFITKCNGTDLAALKEDIRKYNKHAEILECAHEPVHLEDVASGERHPLSMLKDLRVGAISGIARPESFEDGLRRLGAEVIYSKRYADHHRFAEEEIRAACQRTRARGSQALLTTEKDAVRFPEMIRTPIPVYMLRVEIKIMSGQESWDSFVSRICRTDREKAEEILSAHAHAEGREVVYAEAAKVAG